MEGSKQAATVQRESVCTERDAGRPGVAEGLRLFLDLGVAQLDAAMRDSDAQVGRLAESMSLLAQELRDCGRGGRHLDAAAFAALGAHVQGAVRGLQFYDKLM